MSYFINIYKYTSNESIDFFTIIYDSEMNPVS